MFSVIFTDAADSTKPSASPFLVPSVRSGLSFQFIPSFHLVVPSIVPSSFHRICNPMVLNMRIYNPENNFLLYKPSTRKHAAEYKEEIVFSGSQTLILICGGLQIRRNGRRNGTTTPRNDRHGKHTLSQVGNPVPRSTGQYFAESTRVLAAEYADALRTACPRFPQFALPSSSAPSSFRPFVPCPFHRTRSIPLFHRIRSIAHVPSDLQSDGAKYEDLQSGKNNSAFINRQRENTQRQTKKNLFLRVTDPYILYAADCKSAETRDGAKYEDFQSGKHIPLS